MLHLHHLHRSSVTASDLRGQLLSEERQLFAVRRANVGRKVSLSAVLTVRSKQEQIRKLACCQPREPAVVIHLPECQAPVTIEPVPAEVRGVEGFAAHGFRGIAVRTLCIVLAATTFALKLMTEV
jgi:hypothetical protein